MRIIFLIFLFLIGLTGCERHKDCKPISYSKQNPAFIYYYEPHSKTCFIAFTRSYRLGTQKVECTKELIAEANSDLCLSSKK